MKNFGCVVILVVVLALLLILVLPLLPANAADNAKKTPIPHHNLPDKSVPANCHSRHAREAGISCDDETGSGTSQKQPAVAPNSNKKPLPTASSVPGTDPKVYLPLLLKSGKSGTLPPYPYPAP